MVSGVDVRKYNLEALRDQVSMVLQKNVLFSGTIYRQYPHGATKTPLTKKCKSM